MATLVDQAPHFGDGSNSADGPASLVDHENAVFGDLVNKIRTALARSSDLLSSGCYTFHWFEDLERISNMETLYDRGLFYRAVIESCNQEFDDHDNYIRDLVKELLLPREYYLAIVINDYLSKKDLTHATEEICSLRSSEIQ